MRFIFLKFYCSPELAYSTSGFSVWWWFCMFRSSATMQTKPIKPVDNPFLIKDDEDDSKFFLLHVPKPVF